MKWSEVCEQFPDRIVLVEALKSNSTNKIRTIEEMSIISDFDDSMTAWKEYKRLHKMHTKKEFYIFDTSKEKAEVIEQFFVGIRGRK